MKMTGALIPRRCLVGLMALVLLSFDFTPLHGAEPAPAPGAGYTLPRGTNEFGLWLGGSPDSSKIFGNVEDRQLFLFALRY